MCLTAESPSGGRTIRHLKKVAKLAKVARRWFFIQMYAGHETIAISPKPARIKMSWSPAEKRIPSWPNTTLTKLNGLLIICRTQGGKLLRYQRLEWFPPWYLHYERYTKGEEEEQSFILAHWTLTEHE